jgi:hypothetical protein
LSVCLGGPGSDGYAGGLCLAEAFGVDPYPIIELGGELTGPTESVCGILGQCGSEHMIQVCQLWAPVAELRRCCAEVLADDGHGIGMFKRRRAGEKVKCGRRQRILVGAPVNVRTRHCSGAA